MREWVKLSEWHHTRDWTKKSCLKLKCCVFLQMHFKKYIFICLMMSVKNGRKKIVISDLICLFFLGCFHSSQNQQISYTFYSHKVGHSHLLELQWPSLYFFRPMHACFNLQCVSWHTDSSINSVCDVRLAEHSGCVTRLGCVFFILMCPFCCNIQEQISALMLTPGLTGLAL